MIDGGIRADQASDIVGKVPTDGAEDLVWAQSPGLFYTSEGTFVSKVGTNPASLASENGRGLDPVAIAEDAVIGYQLGNRTLFESVRRLLPWERLVTKNDKTVAESLDLPNPPPDILESLSERVCSAFRDGAALELTGGLDSSLLLALGLWRGVKPQLAFTIGNENSPDVITASELANHYGFPHVRLPLAIDRDRIVEDAYHFIRATGYCVNIASYAWLPATLAALDGRRTAQISGLVGEICGGFFYSSIDPIISPLHLERLWVRYRLMRPTGWRALFQKDVAGELNERVMQEALHAVRRGGGSWRERIDAYYQYERVRRWAIPILDASRTYYDVILPLLSPEYIGWANSLPPTGRAGRRFQYDLLARVSPELANIGQRTQVSAFSAFGTTVKKIFRRLGVAARPRALGTIEGAVVLASDAEVRTKIEKMAAESDVGFSTGNVARILDTPQDHPELVGVLVTTAVAWHDLRHATISETRTMTSTNQVPGTR